MRIEITLNYLPQIWYCVRNFPHIVYLTSLGSRYYCLFFFFPQLKTRLHHKAKERRDFILSLHPGLSSQPNTQLTQKKICLINEQVIFEWLVNVSEPVICRAGFVSHYPTQGTVTYQLPQTTLHHFDIPRGPNKFLLHISRRIKIGGFYTLYLMY